MEGDRMTSAMETRYYEGCGREGPIRCIFLSEFHPVAGPKIACQFPEDYISKEEFDSINAYIIPKPQVQKCIMTINALGHKIVGYPIRIDNPRYERNAYLFNLCFVCDSWSRTVQYEPVVKKLGEHLTIMEEETRFVSSGSSKLPTLLAHLLHDLNTHRKATLVEGDTVMHLKVVEVRADPVPVADHQVPVLVANFTPAGQDLDSEWDLTTRQLLPHMNGYKHVARIAADANVEKTLVKCCIQNLVYYGAVALIPVVKYSSQYRATPRLARLFRERELQRACLAFLAAAPPHPHHTNHKVCIEEVVEVMCQLQQGTTLRTAAERARFDPRRLVVFALLHDLLTTLHRYPVHLGTPKGPWEHVKRLFTGRHCTDEICCLAHVDLPTLDTIIEEDPEVTVLVR